MLRSLFSKKNIYKRILGYIVPNQANKVHNYVLMWVKILNSSLPNSEWVASVLFCNKRMFSKAFKLYSKCSLYIHISHFHCNNFY